MMHAKWAATVLVVIALALTGCTGGGGEIGVLRAPDGTMHSATPENVQMVMSMRIANRVQSDNRVSARWTVTTDIRELPEFRNDFRETDGLSWRTATITATFRAPSSVGDIPLSAADVVDLARRELGDRLVSGGQVNVELVRANPTRATAGDSLQEPVDYLVQDGDTLAMISAAFYGSPNHWQTIVAANPGLDPAALPYGETIVIPPLASADTPVQPDGERYTVLEGDSLGSIAQDFYGDAAQWRRISEANGNLDPFALEVGQVLIIPPAP